jgi:tetratricopeptide (TPR) repeat protein
MFLNKKALTKIWLITGAYIAVAALCFFLGILCAVLEVDYILDFVLGGLCLAASPLIYKYGCYAEGKGKLIAKGNKFILHQLRPAEFIRLYEEKRNDPGNVVSKPDFEVLQMLAIAYDATGDTVRTLETTELMVAAAPKKKLNRAKLAKCSLLFSLGHFEEAEAIYSDVANSKLDMISKYLADVTMKSDRALALGDLTTAEAYFRQALARKSTPLSALYSHYHLATICYRTNGIEEAEVHRSYCIENGGETNTQRKAATGEIYL